MPAFGGVCKLLRLAERASLLENTIDGATIGNCNTLRLWRREFLFFVYILKRERNYKKNNWHDRFILTTFTPTIFHKYLVIFRFHLITATKIRLLLKKGNDNSKNQTQNKLFLKKKVNRLSQLCHSKLYFTVKRRIPATLKILIVEQTQTSKVPAQEKALSGSMFVCLKPKIGCLSSIPSPIDEH